MDAQGGKVMCPKYPSQFTAKRGLGSDEEGNGNPLQYSCLRNPVDRGAWQVQPVHSEGDQPWDFFGGNDAEDETPVLWPPHAKS